MCLRPRPATDLPASPTRAQLTRARLWPGIHGRPVLTPPVQPVSSTPLVARPLMHTHVPCGSCTLPPALCLLSPPPEGTRESPPNPHVLEPATLYSINNSEVKLLWLNLLCGFDFLIRARLPHQDRSHLGPHHKANLSTSEGLKSRCTCCLAAMGASWESTIER